MTFLSRKRRLQTWIRMRPWRDLTGSGLLRLFAWGTLGGALEVLGRTSPNEWVDALGVLGITLALTLAVGRLEEEERRVRLRRLGTRLRSKLAGWRLRSGLDLRGTPALQASHPWRYAWLLAGIAVSLVAVLASCSSWPTGVRGVLQQVSGLIYLTLLFGLWSFLGLGTLTRWVASFAAVDDKLDNIRRKHRWIEKRRSMYGTLGFGAFMVVSLAGLFLPPWIPLAIVAVTVLIYILAVRAPGSSLFMIWKCPARDGGPYASRWICWDVALIFGLAMLLTIPIVMSTGQRLAAVPFTDSSLSTFLGGCFAWSLALFAPACLGYVATRLRGAWNADPSRPARIRVHVAGVRDEAQEYLLRTALEGAGFTAGFHPEGPAPTDVALRLDESHIGGDVFDDFFAAWPRRTAPGEFGTKELETSLRRRAHLQYRRILFRRLKTILKNARSKKYERGEGYWIAPHLWFATHLTRDTDEETRSAIGPAYRDVIPREALNHLWNVMKDADIDLVFLEDGVRFTSFRRVMAAVFEFHDLFGERPLEDGRHFSGIPGVRVMIHEFHIEEPLQPKGYPEPDYEDLGRARILHIYKDRGGDEVSDDIPDDLSSLPIPVGSFGSGPLSLF